MTGLIGGVERTYRSLGSSGELLTDDEKKLESSQATSAELIHGGHETADIGRAVGGGMSDTDSVGQVVVLPPGLGHSLLTLVGASFLAFEFIFINLYLSDFWFNTDISTLGLLAILATLAAAHVGLCLLERPVACRIFSPILRGRPPIFYRKWLTLSDTGIACGIRHIRWEAVESMDQTFFGNLLVKSRLVVGDESYDADVVLKMPFTAADPSVRRQLVEETLRRRPSMLLNKRLSQGLASPFTKTSRYTALMTGGFMLYVLLDLGYASFYYLEVLKNYHLSTLAAFQDHEKAALRFLDKADGMRSHPFPLSWLVRQFFLNQTANAADLDQMRSEVFWHLGRRQEALAEGRRSLLREKSPVLRRQLRQSRLLALSGRYDEARELLGEAVERHESALMARLYRLAVLRAEGASSGKMKEAYRKELDECYETTFGAEPHWPPIKGNRHFIEIFYSEDLRFVVDHLLGLTMGDGKHNWYQPPADPAEAKMKPLPAKSTGG